MQISFTDIADLDPTASEVQVIVPVADLADVVRRMEAMGFTTIQCAAAGTFEGDPASASAFDCVFHRSLS